MTWKLWIAVALAVVAAVFGSTARHRRQLEEERQRARQAEREAVQAKNGKRMADARAEVERIERELAADLQRGVVERVAAEAAAAKREYMERQGR